MNKLFLSLLIGIILCIPAIAQQSVVDSNPSELLRKTKLNQKRGNLEGAIGFGLLGLDASQSTGDWQLSVEFKDLLGNIYLARKNYKKAIFYYLYAAMDAEKHNDLNAKGQGYFSLANVYSSMGAFNKAKDGFTKVYASYEKEGNKIGMAKALKALGSNYSISNQSAKAIEAYEILYDLSRKEGFTAIHREAVEKLFVENEKLENNEKAIRYGIYFYSAIKTQGNNQNIANVANQLSNNYGAVGNHNSAIRYAQEAVDLFPNNTLYLESLGMAYAKSGNEQNAIRALEKSLDINQARNHQRAIATDYNYLGLAEYLSNNDRAALSNVQKAEKIAVERNYKEVLAESYRIYSIVYERKGSNTQASQYKKQQQAVTKQIPIPASRKVGISESKENLAESYEQDARVKLSSRVNQELAKEREKLKSERDVQRLTLLEQHGRIQEAEIQRKELEADRAKQNLLIAEKEFQSSEQTAQLKRIKSESRLQQVADEERQKIREQEKVLQVQETKLLASELEAEEKTKLLFYIIIGAAGLFLLVGGIAFYRTYKTGKTINEQNINLADQQNIILNRNLQLKKSSDAMMAMNNKLKKAHENLRVLLKKEQKSRENFEKANSDLKNAQVHLVQAEKMSSLGLLTAGIAHEINNPINFVSSGVQSLTENYKEIRNFIDNYQKVLELKDLSQIQKYSAMLKEDEDVLSELQDASVELLEDVKYGIVRITEIVNGLKSFSRHDEAEVKEADINESFDAALLILKNKYKNKVEIIREMDESLEPIQCFPGQLNQVFVNLINNSIDAIEKEGQIFITTKNLNNEQVLITIEDTGSGIPDDAMKKIFDPFFTTKDVGMGTGLGLSITHGIIEKHKGTIAVESTVGKGTTFTIVLPKKLEEKENILEESLN